MKTDGSTLCISLDVKRVVVDGESLYLAMHQDISERKRQQQLLARAISDEQSARQEAESANRAKDQFLATISHELRTPLNAILGWATILRTAPNARDKLERGLLAIERNARTQEQLVNDLLDVSRIISGKLRLSVERLALWDVLCSAAEVVRSAADAKGVRLLLEVEQDLGEVVGDHARLQQVIWNLLTNAIKFTPRGGRITVTGKRTGQSVLVRVQDTGVGIPADQLSAIFERFRQLDGSITRRRGGLGLGLAIVRNIVEAHGGSVTAESGGSGQGATFEVSLPIRTLEAAVSAGDSVKSDPEAAALAQRLEGKRILLVDDDHDALDVARELLEAAGALVTATHGASEALSSRGPFDIVISDIGMPEIDGYALMKRLRDIEELANVPAIALTAFASADDIARARAAGYHEHLSKPLNAEKLLQTVAHWCSARSLD